MFSALAALDAMPDGGRIFLPALGRGSGVVSFSLVRGALSGNPLVGGRSTAVP